MKRLRIPFVIVLLIVAGRTFNANAQTESNLYSFVGSPTDGGSPSAGLVQGTDGNFYGTTFYGGANNDGTVFRISSSGTYTTLYSFVGSPTDGYWPDAALVQGSDGNFYGTTESGGASGNGTVFRISPSGNYISLYSFADGAYPYAGLVQGNDGNFYGTTQYGGANGYGIVFRITPSGTETTLYSFGGPPSDGARPADGLTQGSDGNFYGTTGFGGSSTNCYGSEGCGTVFRISPSGAYTNLYSFVGSPTDGGSPSAGLVQGGDGNFYGTTLFGGANGEGTVFRISPSGSYTSLYSFVGSPIDGGYPYDSLVQGSDGNFYGTTGGGGANANCANGCGTVFRISPSGTYTNLYSFGSSPTDGANPSAGLVQGSDSNFYGTTSLGGTNGNGTVFRLSVPLSVTATANSWVAGNGKWETGGHWSLGTAPSANDPADLITNASSKTVTIDAVTAGFPSVLTINNLTVSAPLGSASTLLLSNAGTATPLSILNAVVIDTNGALVVNQSAVQVGSYLLVGDEGGGSALSITNGGTVYNGYGYIGLDTSASSNAVLVASSGSVWSNANDLYVGDEGAFNSLTIVSGGTVYNGIGYIGAAAGANNNTVVVSGPGSVWSNAARLFIGYSGSGNQLIITNGSTVLDAYGESGRNSPSSSTNTVLVSGSGSVWDNATNMFVGIDGSDNTLTIANGGMVNDLNGVLSGSNTSTNNIVLVSGSGSVWSNNNTLYVGEDGAGNSLTITNGGTVYSPYGEIGVFSGSSNNTVLVTGSGSVWSNAIELVVGIGDSSNTLTIAGSGTVYSGYGYIGYGTDYNIVLVTDSGSAWNNAADLYVGVNGVGNSLTITNGAVILVGGDLYLGYGGINCVLQVNGGSLFVTNTQGNAALLVSPAGNGPNSLILNSGSVTVNQLVLTNGASSVIAFNGGLLASGGTSVTNNQVFVVGDGSDAATFQLNGGVHSFANNLEITSNAFLTGCGTIEGNVTIDPGGTVVATCGGTLTFSGIVTNNGTMLAVNNTVLQADGLVVNNGLIVATNGTAQFLGGLVNNGVVLTNGCSLTQADLQISSVALTSAPLISNLVVVIKIPSVTCATYQLQVTPSLKPATWTNLNASQSGSGSVLTFFDFNGATNRPGRFYRIDITLP